MIGLLAVSHSAALAEAAVGLARQMAADALIAVAAGAGAEADGTPIIGTDATLVAAALDSLVADGAEGVVVLMDLGSALMSAEMGVEFADVSVPVQLVGAPFVEGLVIGAVTAASGGSLEAVVREASGALDAKRSQLGEASVVAEEPAPEPVSDEASVNVTITDPHGLHARPVSQLVKASAGHDVTVRLTRTGAEAAANSAMRLLMLGAVSGDVLQLIVRGEGAAATAADLGAQFEEIQRNATTPGS